MPNSVFKKFIFLKLPTLLLFFTLFNITLYSQMVVEDNNSNILLEVTDEGTVGSILLPDTSAAPVNTVNKLYNIGGALNWNGSPLAFGGIVGGWTVDNNNVYSNVSGNVGIGTSVPKFKFHMKKISEYPITLGVEWMQPVIGGGGASDWFYYIIGGTELLQGGINMIRKSGSILKFSVKDQILTGTLSEQMRLSSEGFLGVGTATPTQKLHVFNATSGFNKPVALFESGNHTRIDIRGPGSDKSIGLQFSDATDPWKGGFMLDETTNNLKFLTNADGSNARMEITDAGKIGIGTSVPEAMLEVNVGLGSFKAISATSVVDNAGYFRTLGNESTALYAEGKGYAAEFRGIVKVSNEEGEPVVEIGEGLDYSEGFDMSDKIEISPGSVLIIDSDNPGKLTLSKKQYDSKVAGIVAGANNLGSGIKLGGDRFDNQVALAGRVYCNVIANDSDIEPGDLLTTSPIPGYAMKAVDYERSKGAILGKAMQNLEKGKKGKILVLVTLQ